MHLQGDMKCFEANELINHWEAVFHESASKVATEIFMDCLKRGYFDYENIQSLEDIKSLLAKHILKEFEYVLAEVFPNMFLIILRIESPLS